MIFLIFLFVTCYYYIVEKQVNYEDKSKFIRHSLHSFVGPDKKIYTLRYNGITNITIKAGILFQPHKIWSSFRLKITFHRETGKNS